MNAMTLIVPSRKAPKVLAHARREELPLADVMVGRSLSAYVPAIVRTTGLFGPDVVASGDELIGDLQDGVNQLDTDIQQDACGDWYGPACHGQVPVVDDFEAKLGQAEAEGKTLSAQTILEMLGVDATPSNINLFAKCVKGKEVGSAVPRGTLAFCGISVRDQVSGSDPLLPKSHTTAQFRDRWTTFVATFNRFVQMWQGLGASGGATDASGQAQAQKDLPGILSQYNGFRDQFVSDGGTTTAPSIGEPMALTTKIVLVATGVGLIYVLVKYVLPRYL